RLAVGRDIHGEAQQIQLLADHPLIHFVVFGHENQPVLLNGILARRWRYPRQAWGVDGLRSLRGESPRSDCNCLNQSTSIQSVAVNHDEAIGLGPWVALCTS